MKITAEPRSDQWNADDFISGPRTFTIAKVKPGSAEQKYDIDLVEGEGRTWRPPLTVLRLLLSAWGDEADVWVGRRVTLYRDEAVRFGRDQVGGIRISHMSHIDKPLNVALTTTRGKRGIFRVEPLADAPAPAPSVDRLEKAISAFVGIGIDVDHLEAHLSKPRSEWTADDLTTLLAYYKDAKKAADTEAVDQ